MAELKTQPNDADVDAFLRAVEHDGRREDAFVVRALMEEITGEPARMWGDSIVGFGHYHYTYESGREGEWFLTGFSPRKREMTLYIMPGFDEFEPLLAKLGKHRLGRSCLYVGRLANVDADVLRELIDVSIERIKARHA